MSRSYGMYLSAIFRHKGSVYRSLKKRYPKIMDYIEKCIAENRCPFCKRVFSKKFGLYKHLFGNTECHYALDLLISLLKNKEKEEEICRILST